MITHRGYDLGVPDNPDNPWKRLDWGIALARELLAVRSMSNSSEER
jgi:hypothetical protein